MGYVNYMLHMLGQALADMLGLLPQWHFDPIDAGNAAAIQSFAGYVNYFVPVGLVMGMIAAAMAALVLYVVAMFVIHTVRDIIP